jgi:hypothetical protein
MRTRIPRTAVMFVSLCALAALWAVGAGAQPGAGPREKVNQRFTTERPGTPTGIGFNARFHAAGDPDGNPPPLERMVFRPPHGMRYDTNVPERCTASNAELQAMGPEACPVESWLGGGTVEGLIMEPVGHDFVFDHFHHHLDVLNNAHEQIVLVRSEGYTVMRGRIRKDGSIVFDPTTCFPAPPAGGCADDYILQLRTTTAVDRYVRKSHGRLRSYATTPPRCPARGFWKTRLKLKWTTGATDRVVSRQPCRHRHRH